MREGRPSFTAAAVAAARAIAGVDPVAPDLVDGALAWVVRVGRSTSYAATAVNLGSLGLVDHLELRTEAIDDALRRGVEAGAAQLVLLGAGLDARAWRMPELAGARVFEVDHPSTQADKRARIGSRSACAKAVTFVPVDFAVDALGDSLARAGQDPGLPTFWLWEGVTPYLPAAARRATLEALAERSARGSRLAVTYVTPERGALRRAIARVAPYAFRLIGESLLGEVAVDALHAELASVGLSVLEDTAPRDWATRFGDRPRARVLLVPERLAVAVSDGPLRASRAA